MATSEIDVLLRQLSLEEKVSLLAGVDIWHTPEIARLGVGAIKTSDGPSGARGKYAVDGPTAAFVPGPVCQAATWSKPQMRDLGRLLCREAKTKTAHVLLAPTICCARNPLGGRNFECFGEDPFLSGSLAVEYVAGVQETGEVAATPKHFVANEQEHERFSISAMISERALREIYLRPFEMVVKSSSPPDCIMTSYNQVNEQHVDMNSYLIKTILREQWGFKGLVMSDWGGTNSTVESLLAGLDLEMPGPPERRGQKLLDSLGKSADTSLREAVDVSVARVLSLAGTYKLLGLSPEAATATRDTQEISSTTSEDTKLMREIAASGIVLLKNEKGVLPLNAESLQGKQVAFIGPNAESGTPGGGGSASMNPQYLSQPMDSFKAVAATQGIDLKVKYALGANARKWLPLASVEQWRVASDEGTQDKNMVRVDYFANRDLSGPVKETQYRGSSNIDVSDSAPLDFQVDPVPPYSFRVESVVTPSTTGTHLFSLSSVGDSKLYVDGELIVNNDNWTIPGETFYAFGSVEVIGTKSMEAGKEYHIRVEGWVRKEARPSGGHPADANHVFAAHPSVRIGYQEQLPEPEELLAEAVALADESEITVVVLGLSDEWESEGYDRQFMSLPSGQDKLVEALIQRTRRPESIIFVNQSGSPVEVPWVDRVPTFLQAWYGGQEAGNALADVLLGTTNPSGRLPITWPKKYTDLPFASDPESWPGVDGAVIYKEDCQVGYRWYSNSENIQPQWWFGYGQSYTTFKSDVLDILDEEDVWRVLVSVENTGKFVGQEVVQVYIWPKNDPCEIMLVGFEKTRVLEQGEQLTVEVVVKKRDTARWEKGRWILREGDHVFGVGTGVADAERSTCERHCGEREWKAED
ncbi:hypothetical protein ACHAQA_006952 [Verticillium albo-atrum]